MSPNARLRTGAVTLFYLLTGCRRCSNLSTQKLILSTKLTPATQASPSPVSKTTAQSLASGIIGSHFHPDYDKSGTSRPLVYAQVHCHACTTRVVKARQMVSQFHGHVCSCSHLSPDLDSQPAARAAEPEHGGDPVIVTSHVSRWRTMRRALDYCWTKVLNWRRAG